MSITSDYHERAKSLIPGVAQLLSKRPELYCPGQWPAYFRRAQGVEVVDLDGRSYIDVSTHSVGACPLGYADPDVNAAVIKVVQSGNIATPNAPEDVELAEMLVELHPWADMVRYARTGGEIMSVAVRLARAETGRSKIAFCGYHGWHDWYIAANLGEGANTLDGHLMPRVPSAGVPRELDGTALGFPYGDLDALRAIVTEHGDDLAAVIIEPARYEIPSREYLEQIVEITHQAGAVMIFDEITTGFRAHLGGLHMALGVTPDLAVFAKAMSNGYPMAAIIGRREVMELVERAFVSSTYWSERVGPAAALATIKKLAEQNAVERLAVSGDHMRRGWLQVADQLGLPMTVNGIAQMPGFAIQAGEQAAIAKTYYVQLMLDHGYLAFSAFYATLCHTSVVVDDALNASSEAFAEVKNAMDAGDIVNRLRGPVASSGLRSDTTPKEIL